MVKYDHWSYLTIILGSVRSPLPVAHIKFSAINQYVGVNIIKLFQSGIEFDHTISGSLIFWIQFQEKRPSISIRLARRILVIIVRITMNAIHEKRKEVKQTLLSIIESTENERGCQSFNAFRDIEDRNGFDLVAEWKTREDLNRYFRSDRFNVLLETKSLLCEPIKIQIFTVSNSEGMESVYSVRKKADLHLVMRSGTC